MRTKNCPKPPGGTCTCEKGQILTCVNDGHGGITAKCETPKDKNIDALALANRVLATVTGVERRRGKRLTPEDRRILEAGEYLLPDGRLVVFSYDPQDFGLPPGVPF